MRQFLMHPEIAQCNSINYGRPFLISSKIGTTAIYNRYRAGEMVNDIAEDYGIPVSQVEAAIEFETCMKAKTERD